MPAPELKGATTIVVDGYNLLLDLAEEALVAHEPSRHAARARLAEAMSEWARLRDCRVVLVWDGARPQREAAERTDERLRQVYVAATEADDFIVEEVARLRREGRRPAVVTRDRELLTRLPEGVARLGHEQVGSDLRALAADPLRAPSVIAASSPEEIPASRPDQVDPSKLPRRRRPTEAPSVPPAVGATAPRRPPSSSAGPARRPTTGVPRDGSPSAAASDAREEKAREQARQKKEARRERYRRAQRRKKK